MFTEKLIQGSGSATTSSDPYFDNVSVLLSGDSWDSSPTPKQITPYGVVTVSTSQKKYGSGSWYFDNSGNNYLQYQDNVGLGSNDFTIEFWYNTPTGFGSGTFNGVQAGLLTLGCTKANNIAGFSINDNFMMYMSTDGVSYQYMWACPAVTTNTWTHLAFVRNGSNFYIFQNGTLYSTNTMSGSLVTLGGDCIIGKKIAGGLSSTGFTVYMDDLRITKGVARYTANFTPPSASLPTTTDPYWNNVSFLLKGNSWDSGPSAKAITLNGNARTDITTKKYGSGSWYFDGTGDSLTLIGSTNFNFGTGDFTVEAFSYLQDSTGWRDIICFVSTINWGLTTNNGYIGAYNIGIDVSGTLHPLNQWCHVAVTRQNGTVYLFLNGTLIQQASNSSSLDGSVSVNIGAWTTISSENWMGYIDDLRVTKGVARYTANFTPPSAAYYQGLSDETTYNTVLLLNGNGTNGSTVIRDSSPARNVITVNGNAQISTAQKKYGTGSLYFDGTGDYLSMTDSAAFTLGTSDFTIEGWFYQVAAKDYAHIFSTTLSYGTTNNIRLQVSAGVFNIYTGNAAIFTGVSSVSNSVWVHFAVVRSGSTITLYKDGISVASNTSVTNSFVTDSFIVGGDSNYQFNGYIDDFRVTKGYARYTANFTPPTAELTP